MSQPHGPGGYHVGRGKPPTQHRFAPGKSGNPKGRPRKVKDALLEQASSDLNEIIIREAERLLTMQEDGKVITLSAVEAVTRKMMVTAAKGNAHAQRNFMQMVLTATAQRGRTRAEMIANAYSLKIELEDARVTWVAMGRDEQNMPVHPSDIEFDGQTGEVRCLIALTDEERAARRELLSFLEDAHAIIKPSATSVPNMQAWAGLEHKREIAIIQIHFANEYLPPRFRRPPPNDFALETELGAQFIETVLASLPGIRPEFAKRLRARSDK